MGNKAGYSAVILAALGLRSGGGADAYWWAEADADVAALLRAYPDAALLRRIAEIIRGWAGEEPRALWERLRAERRARGPREDANGVAGWVVVGGWSFRGANPDSGFNRSEAIGHPESHKYPRSCDVMAAECTRLAEYSMIAASNRLINVAGPDLTNTGAGGTTFGGEAFATPAREVAERFEGMAREVAGYGILAQWAFRRGEPDSGYNAGLLTDREPTPTGGNGAKARTCEQEAGLWEPAAHAASGWPPVRVTRSIPTAAEVADALGTPGDLEGVVVYMDPPYQGTTGYAHDLGRAEVVAIARAFDALGAVVAISEADIVIPDWHAVEITGGRRGQKRTFSRQQAEWLTVNREPAHRVAVQTGLFEGA